MSIEAPIAALFETTLATSAAVLLVLCLRKPLMAKFGASVAYAAWALVPVAWLAVLLPAPEVPAMQAMTLRGATVGQFGGAVPATAIASLPWQSLLIAAWALGACGMSLLFWRQQRRFDRGLQGGYLLADGMRVAHATSGLPAVVGVLRPRIVLPADFETRYGETERELILCHERIHVARFDLQANALVAALRALYWFNPLMHYAARRFRHDQELACDERVVARHPNQRRTYADAMLKTQMADTSLPVGCHWQASTPLKERIAMLKEHAHRPMRSLIGAALVSLLFVAGGYAAWAAQPARVESRSGPYYSVKLHVEIDGEASNFEVREYAGKPFSFVSTASAGRAWRGEFQVKPWEGHEDAVLLSGNVYVDGKLRANPALGVKLGNAATVQMDTEDGSSMFKMDATIVKVDEKTAKVPEGRQTQADDEGATPVSEVPPEYPATALAQKLNGEVILLVDVDAEGNAGSVVVEKSEPPGVFDDVALAAAKKWKFAPAREGARAVPGRVRVPMYWDAGMDSTSAPAGREDDDRYNWFAIDTRKSRISPQGTCDVILPAADAGIVTCGKLRPERL